MGMPDGTGRCPGVGGGTVRVSSRGVVSVVFLCVALLGIALSTPQIFRTLKEYWDGPSVQGAFDSYTVQNDRDGYGLTYRFLYEDTDEAGQVRYHFVSTEGGNIPLVLTCEFRWVDNFSFFHYRPAGWNYVCSNSEEWLRAYDAWELSPGYDGPRRHLFDGRPGP